MSWWPFRRRSNDTLDTPQGAHGDGGDPTRRSLMGRLFLRGVPYVLPKDMGEVNRLDFQHYMMRAALHGNYAAPISAPESILDVGCGTGRWAIEMAQLFPTARVVGIDVVPPSMDTTTPEQLPPNYSFQAGNILEGLALPDASFAFVHQRYMIGAIPAERWPGTVSELARLTSPGGWVELVEAGTSRGGGRALETVDKWVAAVLARRNLNIHLGARLGDFLTAAGLQEVTVREVPLPLGAYGGRVGVLVETDYFSAITAMRGPVVALGIASEADYDQTVQAAREEVRKGKCIFPVYVAYAHRA
jgi:SAM-dependent methyltransferase